MWGAFPGASRPFSGAPNIVRNFYAGWSGWSGGGEGGGGGQAWGVSARRSRGGF